MNLFILTMIVTICLHMCWSMLTFVNLEQILSGFLTFVSPSPLNNIYAIYWENRSALARARLIPIRWSLVVLSGSDAIPNARQRGLQFWFCCCCRLCCCCCDFYGGMCQAGEQLSAKLLLIVLKYKNKRIKQKYVVAHTKMSTSN